MYKPGDIVLIPVPFTDLSSHRQRPVIVISNQTYNQKTTDIVVMAMTSNPIEVDYSFTITSSDLVQGQLNRPGKIRVDKIYTLSQSIVFKKFPTVNFSVMHYNKAPLRATKYSRSITKKFTVRNLVQ